MTDPMEKARLSVLQKRIGERLKALGDAASSVKAKEAGLSDSFIRDIIRGKTRSPRADNLQKLALALETTPDYLQGKVDTPAGIAPMSPAKRRLMAAFDALEDDLQEVALNRVLALVPSKSEQPSKVPPEEDGQ